MHHPKRPPSTRRHSHARPLFTFTIPSLHDSIPLDCRIYHPPALPDAPRSWSKVRGAILAHPYAPLGGSQNDPVVLLLVETLLRLGWIIATFNFRGAADSVGTTSWSARPEVEDYESVIGLMTGYLVGIVGERARTYGLEGRGVGLSLGGYSYGSMVLSMLPSVEHVLGKFAGAGQGTAAAEIGLRAKALAEETLTRVQGGSEKGNGSDGRRGRALLSPDDATVHSKGGMTFGGEETSPDVRRRSQEQTVRKSQDAAGAARHKVRDIVKRKSSHASSAEVSEANGEANEKKQQHDEVTTSDEKAQPESRSIVDVQYLLISPLLPPLSHFLSLSLTSWMPKRLSGVLHRSAHHQQKAEVDVNYQILEESRTLVIFGSEDGFTSSRKLATWAEQTKQANKYTAGAGFDWEMVKGAGHFWREEDVADVLSARVSEWAA